MPSAPPLHSQAKDGALPSWQGRVHRVDGWIERHALSMGVLLYAMALGLRLWHWFTFRDTLLARVFLMDEAYYHEEAWNLVRGIPHQGDSYFMNPLYPMFLSLLMRAFGDAVARVYAVQLALGALTAPLVFVVARRAMRGTGALCAGIVVATCAPLVFYESLLLVEWIVALGLMAATWLAVRAPSRGRSALLGGACLGVASLARGSNLLLLPAFALWFGMRRGVGKAGWAQMARLLLGCVLVLSPLLIWNARHAEQPLLLTANAGFNLYLGNGPESTGLFQLPEGLDLAQDPLALRAVQRETQTKVTASVASHYWLAKTWEHMQAHPLRALDLLAWKGLLFWNRYSFPQVESFASATRLLPLSHLPFWHGGWIFPLALLGIVFALAHGRRAFRRDQVGAEPVHFFLAVCVILYAFSIVLFFVTDRYRVPAMPWLVLLAVMGVGRMLTQLAGGHRKQLLGSVVLLSGLFAVTDPGRIGVDRARVQRDVLVHDALREAKAGMFDAAVASYAAALQSAPRDADLRDGMARMLSRAGRDSLALGVYADLLLDEPRFGRGWYNLGNLLRRMGRQAEAVQAYRQAVEIDPWREAAWNNLGESERALGDTLAAARAYHRALELVPGYEQALNNLAALRGFQGDAEAAESGFREAIAANPRYLPAWKNLAILLTNQRRLAEARTAWQNILVLDPGDSLAHEVLRRIAEEVP